MSNPNNPTRISVRADEYKSVASTVHGHNQNTMAFNIGNVAEDYPEIAVKLMNIYTELPLNKEK